MAVTIIVGAAENGVIGANGDMPWRQRDDLRRFRRITTGHPVVMGRKTYETIGRPLPERTNIVVTRQQGYSAPGCLVAHDLASALELGAGATGGEDVYVMGGGVLYAEALSVADAIELTRIHAEPAGDTWFRFAAEDWTTTSVERHEADEHNQFPYSFVTLRRAQK